MVELAYGLDFLLLETLDLSRLLGLGEASIPADFALDLRVYLPGIVRRLEVEVTLHGGSTRRSSGSPWST